MQKKEKKLKEGRKFVLRLADIFGYSRLLANNFHMAACIFVRMPCAALIISL